MTDSASSFPSEKSSLPVVGGAVAERDPVCGMSVNPAKAGGVVEYEGRTFYFCSKGCAEKFRVAAEKYLAGAKAAGTAMNKAVDRAAMMHASTVLDTEEVGGVESGELRANKASYTCPMHPEVVRGGPGACPICGMALEPVEVSAAEEVDPEYLSMRLRFWVCAVLSVPLLVLAMGEHWLTLPVSAEMRNWIELTLATPVVLWGGWPFFERFWMSVVHRSPNMFTLIGLGTAAAYLDSLVATLFPQIFPASFRGMDGAPAVYFEAAAVITTLVLLGQVLELRARQKTSGAIRALLQLAPQQAHVLASDGGERDVALGGVAVGDRLRVRPGERVPTDGEVIEGASAVDESMLTGEAIPAEKSAGEKVTGGTLNTSGSFVMRAERVGSETMLAHIVKLVNEAQRSRAPMQRLADQVAGYFVPAVIAAAGVAFVAWAVFGPQPRLAHALVAAIAVLIIACPCALGLATPMSVMVAVGRGAHAGVLIRSAEALETLAKVDTLVIDKTGTLTEGKPRLSAVVAARDVAAEFSEDELLALAASLERGSEHPLGRAIVQAALEKNLEFSEAENFAATAGGGVDGVVRGRRLVAGTQKFLEARKVAFSPAAFSGAAADSSATAVYLGIDGRAAAMFLLKDRVKDSAPGALKDLRDQGLRIVMLTGDRRETAEQVAKELGIEEVEAGVQPEQKGEIVRRLRSEGRVVAMAGDGINDAPALAAAQVGIAMGTGTDVAMSSAGITLVKGDLQGIVRARRLSRATIGNIKQNLAFAFLYNALGVPVAAGAFYPLFGWLLSPMLASAAMSFSSVSVIANALRLRKVSL